MNDSLTHRGPDGDGFHFEPGVVSGTGGLSIIDLEGGKQPLYNEDETVVVTYNGEIYNFQELAKSCSRSGTCSEHTATPKSSCMPGSNGARSAWIALMACLPSRFGTAISERFSWRVTGSASSRFITRCSRTVTSFSARN